MSAHEFHHCEHTPLGPPPIDTAEQIRQATAEGEKVGAMLSEHLRTTSTPIDPADIRPGDVVRIVREVTVEQVAAKDCGEAWLNLTWVASPGDTFLVHRPDPDAEAVEVMEAIGMTYVRTYLVELRKRGWDVTRRAES